MKRQERDFSGRCPCLWGIACSAKNNGHMNKILTRENFNNMSLEHMRTFTSTIQFAGVECRLLVRCFNISVRFKRLIKIEKGITFQVSTKKHLEVDAFSIFNYPNELPESGSEPIEKSAEPKKLLTGSSWYPTTAYVMGNFVSNQEE